MITVITGKPGSGKTSLLTAFLANERKNNGRKLLHDCTRAVLELNTQRKAPLTLPEQTPLYTDFAVKIPIGYKKYFKPYFISGFFIGLQNEFIPALLQEPPYSKIFLSEVQRYLDSRKKALPDWVSRMYEQHRHFHFEFFLELQRVMLIDKNIRDLAERFIEVQELEHEYDSCDNIIKSTWHCIEFESTQAYEQYLTCGEATYRTTEYSYTGNIFKCYNSYERSSEFVPDEGKDFNYRKHLSSDEIKNLPSSEAVFYNSTAPKEYWTQDKGDKNDKNGARGQARRTQTT